MIRYLTYFSEAERKKIKELDGAFILDKAIPDVPHCVVNIQLLRFDPTYEGTSRPRGPFYKRFVRGLKAAWTIFTDNYCA